MPGKKMRLSCSAASLLLLIMISSPKLGLADDDARSAKKYLITNDNQSTNTATVYQIGGSQTAPTLTLLNKVGTGGAAGGGGVNDLFRMLAVADVAGEACGYIANDVSNNITGIVIAAQAYAGIFAASTKDSGLASMVSNGTYLYASYYSSRTIAAFQMTAGCGLSFVGDAAAAGLANGYIYGMAVHGDTLVVSYGDQSIESFNVSAGVPASNGDKQYATSRSSGLYPYGVDITENGDYAVFGDCCGTTTIEVSNMTTGKLTPTVLYTGVSTGTHSANVLLSPNDSLLYISDYASADVSAVKFNQTSGMPSPGCISGKLNMNGVPGIMALNTTSGTGGAVYVAEYNASNATISQIGAIAVTSTRAGCTLTELTTSPFSDPNARYLQSIAVYPPRPF